MVQGLGFTGLRALCHFESRLQGILLNQKVWESLCMWCERFRVEESRTG